MLQFEISRKKKHRNKTVFFDTKNVDLHWKPRGGKKTMLKNIFYFLYETQNVIPDGQAFSLYRKVYKIQKKNISVYFHCIEK